MMANTKRALKKRYKRGLNPDNHRIRNEKKTQISHTRLFASYKTEWRDTPSKDFRMKGNNLYESTLFIFVLIDGAGRLYSLRDCGCQSHLSPR